MVFVKIFNTSTFPLSYFILGIIPVRLRQGLVNHLRWKQLRRKVFGSFVSVRLNSVLNMACLRSFLVFCSIVFVLSNSMDLGFDEMDGSCCSKCRCEYSSTLAGEKQELELDCSNKNLTEIPMCPFENFTRV